MRRLPALLSLIALGGCAKSPARPGAASLLNPDPATLDAPSPDSFTVRFTTSRGPFDVKVHRDWAPRGADRLYFLAHEGFYDGVRFFRVLENFVAQFGAHGDTAVARAWRERRIPDDPVTRANIRGTLTFATSGINSRTTQLFINLRNNPQLDQMGFAVVGEVVSGMPVVDSLYKGYGDGPPNGGGPDQGQIAREGDLYFRRRFPKLDYVVTARIAEEWPNRKS